MATSDLAKLADALHQLNVGAGDTGTGVADAASDAAAALAAALSGTYAPRSYVDEAALSLLPADRLVASTDPDHPLQSGQILLVVADDESGPSSLLDFGQPLVWIDAQQHSEADGASVSTLTDRSGYNNHFTPYAGVGGPATTDPVMDVDGLGGHKAFTFAAASQFATPAFLTSEGGAMTVVFVAQIDSAAAKAQTLCDGVTGTGDRIGIVVNTGQVLQATRASTGASAASTVPTTASVFAVVFKADGTGVLYINSTSHAISNPGASTLTGLQLGGRFNGVNRLEGKLGEFALFPRECAAGEVAAITAFLRTKWGV